MVKSSVLVKSGKQWLKSVIITAF
ncbi:KxYKxGKxW signal peptide domain-containing protein [Pseudoalteromonas shioyasakiensis]